MSYRKRHVKKKVRKIKAKKPVFARFWFWCLIFGVFSILCFFYFFFFYPGFQINKVLVSGNEKMKKNDLEAAVFENANTGFLKISRFELASRSIFLANPKKIRDKILEQFPGVEKADIGKLMPETLDLRIVERKPVGVYCHLAGGQRCFLIDKTGIVFEMIESPPDNLAMIRQVSEGEGVSVGQRAIDSNVAEAVFKIKNNLEENFQISIAEALITTPIRLDITTSEGWRVYFDLNSGSDIDNDILKLNLLLSGEIAETARTGLKYIDLRFEDRAFYK